MEIIQLKDGYDRRKEPRVLTFRLPETLDELDMHCRTHAKVWIRGGSGTAKMAKVNGKVKRWVKNPNRIEIPMKYGLRIYFKVTEGKKDMVLIPVEG